MEKFKSCVREKNYLEFALQLTEIREAKLNEKLERWNLIKAEALRKLSLGKFS